MNNDQLIPLVIFGASGNGRDILWTIKDINKISKKYEILGFLDDNHSLHGKILDEVKVLGGIDWFKNNKKRGLNCIVAVADSKIRKKITKELEKLNIEFPTVIHPSVTFSSFKHIGKGVIIQAGCVFAPNTQINDHVQINLDSTIGHNTILENFVTITTGVHIGGDNKIGEGTFFGSGSVTIEKISVGKYCIIGAGTVIIDNIPEKSMYVGVPGRFKKKLTPN